MSMYTEAIEQFNTAFNVEISEEKMVLYQDLIDEEYEEWLEERYSQDKNEYAEMKEMADILYVIFGYAAQRKWDMDKAFKLVHESNMSKLHNGIVKYNSQGKILKGPGYKQPNLEGCK